MKYNNQSAREIDKLLRGYDCMLVETGGTCDGKNLLRESLAIAKTHIENYGSKETLILVIDNIIDEYKGFTNWKHLEAMMNLLNNFKSELQML